MAKRSHPRRLRWLLAVAAVNTAVACQPAAVLDENNGQAVVTLQTAPQRAETDEAPAHHVALPSGAERVVRTAAVLPSGRSVLVNPRGELRLAARDSGPDGPTLLDGVIGRVSVVDETRVVAVRETSPGESDLWVVDTTTGKVRAIAAAPGPDDGATALPDGRVFFVSARTGVASLWVVDVTGGEPRQITNRGEVPGKLSAAFVPPPEVTTGTRFDVDGDTVTYDAGGTTRVRVSLTTGRGEVIQ